MKRLSTILAAAVALVFAFSSTAVAAHHHSKHNAVTHVTVKAGPKGG
jgi:hypothetical protein